METTRRPKIVDFALPTIALIGRVNVGKSTLFNSIVEKNRALVSPVPGTTRTRNIAQFQWRGKMTRLIDAGGLTFQDGHPFEDEVLSQTQRAVKEADVIIFVVDTLSGLLPQEKEIARLLHKTGKPVFFIMNKADSPRLHTHAYDADWLKLGFGVPRPVSAVNGMGIGDLLDDVFKALGKLKKRPKRITLPAAIRVAIIGVPNVGKSTLLNQLVGDDLVITSDKPHTTRETFDLLVEWNKKYFEFLDTAGIRRKARVEKGLEHAGVSQSLRSMDEADVVLLLLDATNYVSTQEKLLAMRIGEKRRSLIVLINKWDLMEDQSEEARKKFLEMLAVHYPHIAHAHIMFVSAKTGYKVHDLFAAIVDAYEARRLVIDPLTLDAFLRKVIARHSPTRGKGTNFPKLFSLKQIGSDPPEFQLSVKARTSVHSSYLKFIERMLREDFGFIGAPIVVYAKKTKR